MCSYYVQGGSVWYLPPIRFSKIVYRFRDPGWWEWGVGELGPTSVLLPNSMCLVPYPVLLMCSLEPLIRPLFL